MRSEKRFIVSFLAEPTKLSNNAIREYAERVGEHYDIINRAGNLTSAN